MQEELSQRRARFFVVLYLLSLAVFSFSLASATVLIPLSFTFRFYELVVNSIIDRDRATRTNRSIPIARFAGEERRGREWSVGVGSIELYVLSQL